MRVITGLYLSTVVHGVLPAVQSAAVAVVVPIVREISPHADKLSVPRLLSFCRLAPPPLLSSPCLTVLPVRLPLRTGAEPDFLC